jgi:hypothetical protein
MGFADRWNALPTRWKVLLGAQATITAGLIAYRTSQIQEQKRIQQRNDVRTSRPAPADKH